MPQQFHVLAARKGANTAFTRLENIVQKSLYRIGPESHFYDTLYHSYEL